MKVVDGVASPGSPGGWDAAGDVGDRDSGDRDSGDRDSGVRDHRTLDQARADVFCDLLIEGTCTAHPEAARGIRPTVVVTVSALALLDTSSGEHGFAQVDGVGPIPIGKARELCGGSDGWMPVLTHPDTCALEWTSPTGRHYTVRPERTLPTFTAG